MEIFITRDDEDYGPYTVEEAQHLLASGELLPEDYAWYEGAPDWMALEEVPGIVPSVPTPEHVPEPAPGPAPTRISTGLPAWIPPRRGDDPATAGPSPTSFVTPTARLGIVVPRSPVGGKPATPSPAGPPRRSAAASSKSLPRITPAAPVHLATPVPAPAAAVSAPAPSNYVKSQASASLPGLTRSLRSMGMKNMIIGGLICAVGTAITFFSYESASSDPHGGSYTIAWGAVLFGGIQFVRGLILFLKS